MASKITTAVGCAVVVVALALNACTSGGEDAATGNTSSVLVDADATATTTPATGPASSTAATDEPVATTDQNAPTDTSDPTVISRRTEGIDVLILPDGIELPAGYTQAAVPVDAFAASEIVISPSTAAAESPQLRIPPGAPRAGDAVPANGTIDVTVSIRSCRLVTVWVLPHPDEVVVGYEEYPELTCVSPLDHVVTFEVPATGNNSEGPWNYSVAPPLQTYLKVGPFE